MKTQLTQPVYRGFLIFIVLAFAWVVVSVFNVVKAVQTLSWPHTEGTVISSGYNRSSASKGTTKYYPEIAYTYTVDTTEYTSRQYYAIKKTGSMLWAKQIAEKYAENDKVQVYYKPGSPANSVLITGLHSGNLVMLGISTGILIALILALKYQLKIRGRHAKVTSREIM